ncbi:MAG: twin-arginine translocation pathway signal protein [Armatimonadetes bacterium]|nr:twin-arginine translocation pathway signal protein [Armatimonadota bacterium]
MDQDDQFIGRLFTRRQALAVAGRAGLVIATSGGWLTAAEGRGPEVHLVASPSLTQGPFYVNERLQRSDLRAGSRRPSITDAIPLRLDLTLYASATREHFVPLPGAQVDVWHVDALGVYSDEPRGLNPEDTKGENWLRGYQTTDGHGRVTFHTIFPGWYHGRTTHIHFKVRYLRDGTTPATFTSQFFVPDDLADRLYKNEPYRPRPADEMHNQGDQVYRGTLPDGTRVGRIMTLDPQPAASGVGYATRFAIAMVTHPHPSNGGRVRRRA